MQRDYDHGVPCRGESCSDAYYKELNALVYNVIVGELTRDEAHSTDLHHAYNMYGIDVCAELDMLLRNHAMRVAPEWTAYQKKGIDMLIDGHDKLSAELDALKEWAVVARRELVANHLCPECMCLIEFISHPGMGWACTDCPWTDDSLVWDNIYETK